MRARTEVDHLVVAAHTLDEGVRWCEATLGVAPGPGGAHPLMGTHNRLLSLSNAPYPHCYLEIIAIEPGKAHRRGPGRQRWFDLDDSALQSALARDGPQLVHFVARVADAQACLQALASAPSPIDRGRVISASRDSAAGRLDWHITVRDDGQRLFYGALPTLIQWGPVHPNDALAASGITLDALAVRHPRGRAAARSLRRDRPRLGGGHGRCPVPARHAADAARRGGARLDGALTRTDGGCRPGRGSTSRAHPAPG